MKAIAKTKREPGIEVIEAETNNISNSEVLIRMRSASICGSDIGFYNFTTAYQKFAKVPVIMGHEFVGEVVQTGTNVHDFKVREIVACESMIYCGTCRNCRNGLTNICQSFAVFGMHRNGGFAEYVSVDPKLLHRLPGEIDFVEAGVIEPLSVVINGLDGIGNVKVGEMAVVIGPGPLGLLSAELLKWKGATDISIIGIGTDEFRLELAHKLGYGTINWEKENAVETIKRSTDNYGADLAVVTAGAASALKSAIPLTAKGGRIVVLGIFPEEIPLPVSDLVRRQVAILGSYASRWVHYEQAIALLREKKIRVDAIVTHRFQLDQAIEAFETAKSKSGCKVQFYT
jgi:L-iditol 2-dehydrogenase